jgi:two-component system phosphate regulon response regulator PhoB
MAVGTPNILVVEDEPSQLELLSYNLAVEGYEVFRAENGEEALLLLKEHTIDLVILDWMLPEISGLEVCRQIRRNKQTKDIPVIMLTARGEEDDKIRGLDIGANDFVVKPYSIKELCARVRSNLRIKYDLSTSDTLEFEGVTMDIKRHRVQVNNNKVSLGPIEFKLLHTLMVSPTKVFSREELLDRVWASNIDVETRTVDVHIGRLRKQLNIVSDMELIRTVRGFGYSLDSGLN